MLNINITYFRLWEYVTEVRPTSEQLYAVFVTAT